MNTEYNICENKKCDKNDSISIESSFDIDTINETTFIVKTPTRNGNPCSLITDNNLNYDNKQPISDCDYESSDDITYQASIPLFNLGVINEDKECNNENTTKINEKIKINSSKFYIGDEYDEDTSVSANITLHTTRVASSLDATTTTTYYDTNHKCKFYDSSIKEFLDKAKEEFKQKWDNPAQVSKKKFKN